MHILGPSRRANPVRSLQLTALAVFGLLAAGTAGFMALGGASALDALFMTVITVSTVGYGERVPIDTPALELFTIGLIAAALVVVALAVRNVAELIFAEYVWSYVGRQRMQSRIDALEGHIIVCGYGRMGSAVVEELAAEGQPTVVVEPNEARAAAIQADGRLVVHGDATRDEVLVQAGIERARALIATADTDATNVLVVLSARALNSGLLIAARAAYLDVVDKLRRAGADRVLHHHGTAAMHLALAVTHPVVEDVLNSLIPRQGDLDLGQLNVDEDSNLVGRTLAALGAQRHGALVLAIARSGEMIASPPADLALEAGDVLVVSGPAGTLRRLREVGLGALEVVHEDAG